MNRLRRCAIPVLRARHHEQTTRLSWSRPAERANQSFIVSRALVTFAGRTVSPKRPDVYTKGFARSSGQCNVRLLSSAAGSVVEQGDRVEAHMKIVDPESGKVLVETGEETVSFVVGQGRVIPGIEQACEGLKEGETWTGTLEPEKAFGIVNPNLIYDIPIERIPAEVHKDLAVGIVLQIEARKTAARIVSMTDTTVTVDENHELAGKPLDFTINLVSVSKADEAGAWTSVQKQTLREGDGETFPKVGDRVTIHYEGTFASDGKLFDSSRQRNSPLVVQLGARKVINGFEIGLPMLSLGEKAKLFIPSDFAYGPQGAGDVIPPHANLVFEIQVLAINDKEM